MSSLPKEICITFNKTSTKYKFSSRELSNGVERKGKKKSVGRPPGPYTRKMIHKTPESSPLVRFWFVFFFTFPPNWIIIFEEKNHQLI